MTTDPVAELLAEALRGLVWFVEERPEDATADDDVRALEEVRPSFTAWVKQTGAVSAICSVRSYAPCSI